MPSVKSGRRKRKAAEKVAATQSRRKKATPEQNFPSSPLASEALASTSSSSNTVPDIPASQSAPINPSSRLCRNKISNSSLNSDSSPPSSSKPDETNREDAVRRSDWLECSPYNSKITAFNSNKVNDSTNSSPPVLRALFRYVGTQCDRSFSVVEYFEKGKDDMKKPDKDTCSATKLPKAPICNSVKPNNECFLNHLDRVRTGESRVRQNKKSLYKPIVNMLKDLKPCKGACPFDRRVTALCWHPTNPSVLTAASKGGEIVWWNFEGKGKDLFIPGFGAGGSITSMKFHKEKPTCIYTASVSGKVMLQDFQGNTGNSHEIFYDTVTRDVWFCSLDVCHPLNLVCSGDNTGHVYMFTTSGQKAWAEKKKLHRNKVTHIEFNPQNTSMFLTSSIDNTVKLWDMRMVKDRHSYVHVLPHSKPVNSAYFSLTDGQSLLTTDQHSQLRIYNSPSWHLKHVISHPHRQFQHLTPIKAYWHPLEDIVVVGRYPDDNFNPGEVRSIDFFDGHSGDMLYQLSNSGVPGIISLNAFSHLGDSLASAMGFHVIVWRSSVECNKQAARILKDLAKRDAENEKQRPRRRAPCPYAGKQLPVNVYRFYPKS